MTGVLNREAYRTMEEREREMADKTKSGAFSGAPFFSKCFLFAPAERKYIITAHTRSSSQRQKSGKTERPEKHVRCWLFRGRFL